MTGAILVQYFVKIESGSEMGPYEESVVREWLANGVMPRNTPTRSAEQALALPACEVFPGVAPSLKLDPAFEVIGSPYATPEEPLFESGNFFMGFLLSTICSLPALALIVWASPNIGPKTYRGMWWGLVLPALLALVALAFALTKEVVVGK